MRLRPALGTLAAVVALSACGGGGDATAPRATDGPDTSTPAHRSTSTTTAADAGALVARAGGAVPVFAHPGDADPAHVLPATTVFGSARALLVERQQGTWLEVLLPVRPNGSTGWVRRADVELQRVDAEVRVDLAVRTLTLLVDGDVVLETTVAVGTADSPTPTGRFYVVDKLITPRDDSPYGPRAFGLSGHSTVHTDFAGGDGQIGIHGTNDPASIGQAASAGCIRVPNDVALRLDELLPLGTPVTIA